MDINTISQQKIHKAYKSWRSTGTLTSNKTIVFAIYHKFKLISELATFNPDYSLMAKDARREADLLRDIIIARYGKDATNHL